MERRIGLLWGSLALWAAVGLSGADSSRALAQRLPSAAREGWYFVARDEGIVVHAHDRPASAVPIFRGIGDVEADFFTIAAVLADATRHAEWMVSCMHAERVEARGDFDQTFYSQARAPWPVKNRDLVLRALTRYEPTRGEMVTRFLAVRHPRYPGRPDFVRVQTMEGYYRMQALGAARTRVTLQVDVDPGGAIPSWLVKLVTRTYPLDTLRNLRAQIARTRGVYDAEVARLRKTHGPYALPAPVASGPAARSAGAAP